MKPKYIILTISVLMLAVFSAPPASAQEDFEAFKRNRQTQFESFREGRNRQFAEFMRVRWEQYELFKGNPKPLDPSPKDIPKADPEEEICDVETPVVPTPEPAPVVPDDDTSQEIADRDAFQLPEAKLLPNHSQTSVVLLGYKISLSYDPKLQTKLPAVDENRIADGWKKLAAANYEPLLDYLLKIRHDLRLSDWAYFLLMQETASAVYGSRQSNEKTLFTAFMLSNSGYKMKMATDKDQKTLLLLLSIAEEVYETSYYELEGQKYYIIDKTFSGTIRTYAKGKNDNHSQIRLTADKAMIAAKANSTAKVHSPAMGGSVEIAFNPNMVEYYARMPMCDMVVHFNTALSPTLYNSVYEQIGEKLVGLTPNSQVEMLLKFMHEGFPYKTDKEQFGKERYLFAEEMFVYPYSDCEDNSILLARLVCELIGLDVIGLLYRDHAAVAIRMEGNVTGNYVTYNGKKYIICDPTYINAKVGQCMPQYIGKQAKVVPVVL